MYSVLKQIKEREDGALAILLVIVVLSVVMTISLSIAGLRIVRLQNVQDREQVVAARSAASTQRERITRTITEAGSETAISTFYAAASPSGGQTNCDLDTWASISSFTIGTNSYQYCLKRLGYADNPAASNPKQVDMYEVRARRAGTTPGDVVGKVTMTIDALYTNMQQLLPQNLSAGDYLGFSLDVYENTLVSGAICDTSCPGGGSTFTYEWDDSTGTWVESDELLPSNSQADQRFGQDVSVHGDWLAVGANTLQSGANKVGGVYIFQRQSDDTWQQTQLLQPTTGPQALLVNDHYGYTVSLFNDWLAVGVYGRRRGGFNNMGSVYMYQRIGTTWSFQFEINGPDSEVDISNQQFGREVVMYEDYLAVGAPERDTTFLSAGKVYIFQKSGTTWNETGKILSPNGGAQYHFGWSLDWDRARLVVGEPGNDNPNGLGIRDQAGAAYIYDVSAGIPSYVKSLHTGNPTALDLFGSVVSVFGNTVGVSSILQSFVVLFEKDTLYGDDIWNQRKTITGTASTAFGNSLYLTDKWLLVGASLDDTDSNNAGSIYVYDR